MIPKIKKVFLTDNACLGREMPFHPYCMPTTWVYIRLDSPETMYGKPFRMKRKEYATRSRYIMDRLKFFKTEQGCYTGGFRYNLGRDV